MYESRGLGSPTENFRHGSSMHSVGSMISTAPGGTHGVVFAGGGQAACGPTGCGLLGDACLEPTGSSTTVNWKYVGGGKGGYEKLTTMKYVGAGGGGFDKDVRASSCSPAASKLCAGSLLLCVFVGAAYFGMTVLTGPEAARKPMAPSSILLRTPPPTKGTEVALPASAVREEHFAFDCADASALWSSKRKAWCCSKFGVQCGDASPVPPMSTQASPRPSQIPPASRLGPPSLPPRPLQSAVAPAVTVQQQGVVYDCQAGLPNWENEWSRAQKAWCCYQDGVGCKPRVPPAVEAATSGHPVPQQFPAAQPTPPAASSPLLHAKAAMTTRVPHHPSAAVAVATSTPQPASTIASGSRDDDADSAPQASSMEAARTKQSSPDQVTSSHEFDTKTHSASTTSQSPSTQKSHSAVRPKESSSIESRPSSELSTQKPLSAIRKEVTTTAAQVRTPPKSESLGATQSSTTLVSTQRLTTKALILTHTSVPKPSIKKAPTLTHATTPARPPTMAPKSMVQVATPQPPHIPAGHGIFDCQAGAATWENGWSILKRSWCCQHKEVACDPHNCREDLGRWESSWAPSKKSWCCYTKQLGCTAAPEDVQPKQVYDCAVGPVDPDGGWPAAKKEWCCKSKKIGCTENEHPASSYDCIAGFANWQKAWSLPKKAWCCKNVSRGCARID